MAVPYYNYIRTMYENRELRKMQRRRVRDICDPFDLPEPEFEHIYRLTKPMGLYLYDELRDELEPKNGLGLPAHIKILCSVQFMANGGYQRQVGQDHTMTHSQSAMSKYLNQFVTVLHNKLFAKWVHFPGTEQARRDVADMFRHKFGVDNVLGLVDCTHIKIFPPPGPQGAQYKNRRKDAHTINVQLIADAECRIISVSARYPGRVHDAFIWGQCNVRTEMKRIHDNGIGSYFLLGDSGYPLEPWLMTPVLRAEPDTPEERYTEWHCKVRNAIERTNGYLKGSLRCIGIDRTLHYAPLKASQLIYATCVIYNLYKHFGHSLIKHEISKTSGPMKMKLGKYPLTEEEEQRQDREDVDIPEMPAGLLRQAQARRAELIRLF